MRITFCYRHVAPYHQAQLNALALAGLDVTVITFNCFKDAAFSGEGIGTPHFRSIDLVGNCRKSELEQALSESLPDVVLVPGWGHSYAISVLCWANTNKIPCVAISDSQEVDRKRKILTEKIKGKIVSLFSAGFVAGKSSFRYMSELGMAAEKLVLGCDVVDNDHFSLSIDDELMKREMRLARGLPHNYFLAVNRLVPEKNVENLILAYFDYYINSSEDVWSLVVIGAGDLQSELKNLVVRLNIQHKVIFKGAIGYAELPTYYSLASAFILASINETWGLVVNEAMCSGLPVLVSSKCGCAAEIISEGKNGYCFDPLNIVQISKLMSKMSSAGVDLTRMGSASRNIISDWSISSYVAGLQRVIEVALDGPAPPCGFFSRIVANLVARQLSRKEGSN